MKDITYYLNLPYKTVLEYEPVDNTWVAYCPTLGRGTCYAIGESKSEALELLEETKKDIFNYAIEECKSIPEPNFDDDDLPSGNFIVRLPRTIHKKIKYEAEKEGVSLNQYVVSVLSENLGKNLAKASYDSFLSAFSKLFTEEFNIWQSSIFTFKNPTINSNINENYNNWIINPLDEEETPKIKFASSSFTKRLQRVSQ